MSSYQSIKNVIFSALVSLGLCVTGCATPVTHATPSHKAEVTINNSTKSEVKERITGDMINKGYNVIKSDDMQLSFDRPIDNFMVATLMGSRYDSQPNARITYNLIQNKQSVRVIADCSIITNPGSAFERRTDANTSPDTVMIQDLLNFIKYDMEK